MGHNPKPTALELAILTLATCSACSEPNLPAVDFRDSRAIGRWAQAASEVSERDAAMENTDAAEASGGAGAGQGGDGEAGRASPAGTGGASGAGEDAGQPSGAEPDAPRVTFSVTTVVQHAKPAPPPPPINSPERYYYDHAYGPLNIGAIWIEDAQGHYVKTLKVWGGERGLGRAHFLHLVGFTRAFGSADPTDPRAEIDVVAAATLAKHETHEVSWHHRNRTGELTERGEYTLKVEVADFDTKSCQPKANCQANCTPPCDEQNAVCEVQFDTTAGLGPVAVMDTQYCTDMKLRLE